MQKKIRLIILAGCTLLFLLVAPYLVLYSLGYRINLTQATVSQTGGVYVRVWPLPASVTVDGRTGSPTNFLANDSFTQNLVPGPHRVDISKDGYFDYQKSLPVVGGQVTKLEHVILFKKNPLFNQVAGQVKWFSVSPDGNTILEEKAATGKTIPFTVFTPADSQEKIFSIVSGKSTISSIKWSPDSSQALLNVGGQYFLVDFSAAQPTVQTQAQLTNTQEISFSQSSPKQLMYLKSGNLFIGSQALPAVKNVLAYATNSNATIYLDSAGWLYDLPSDSNQPARINQSAFPATKNALYQITVFRGIVFLRENAKLFKLNQTLGTFEPFEPSVSQVSVSSDGQRFLIWNNSQVFFAQLDPDNKSTVLLGTFQNPVTNCYWLNDDYIVVQTSAGIFISETDARGNVNKMQLPATLNLQNNTTVLVKNPSIAFSPAQKELYLLTGNTLYNSERLIP